MLLRPRVPTNPAPTGTIYPLLTPTDQATEQGTSPPVCSCQHTPASAAVPVASSPARPVVQVTPGVVVAGTAVVLIVGAVLVSLLLAAAVTAASVAICATVLALLVRWLREQNNRH